MLGAITGDIVGSVYERFARIKHGTADSNRRCQRYPERLEQFWESMYKLRLTHTANRITLECENVR